METDSFHIFWKPLLQLEGGQYFKKILFLLEETFFFFFHFFQTLIRKKVAFGSSEIAFLKESFILAIGTGFLINYKLCAFIRSFFLLLDTILEIRCKPIFFHFFLFLKAEAVFPVSGNEFFIECFILVSGNGFSA